MAIFYYLLKAKFNAINIHYYENILYTSFIQFGRNYKAFAKVVPSGKKIIYALQMSIKYCIIVSSILAGNVSYLKIK